MIPATAPVESNPDYQQWHNKFGFVYVPVTGAALALAELEADLEADAELLLELCDELALECDELELALEALVATILFQHE
jgi:hypothetical protein